MLQNLKTYLLWMVGQIIDTQFNAVLCRKVLFSGPNPTWKSGSSSQPRYYDVITPQKCYIPNNGHLEVVSLGSLFDLNGQVAT